MPSINGAAISCRAVLAVVTKQHGAVDEAEHASRWRAVRPRVPRRTRERDRKNVAAMGAMSAGAFIQPMGWLHPMLRPAP